MRRFHLVYSCQNRRTTKRHWKVFCQLNGTGNFISEYLSTINRALMCDTDRILKYLVSRIYRYMWYIYICLCVCAYKYMSSFLVMCAKLHTCACMPMEARGWLRGSFTSHWLPWGRVSHGSETHQLGKAKEPESLSLLPPYRDCNVSLCCAYACMHMCIQIFYVYEPIYMYVCVYIYTVIWAWAYTHI